MARRLYVKVVKTNLWYLQAFLLKAKMGIISFETGKPYRKFILNDLSKTVKFLKKESKK